MKFVNIHTHHPSAGDVVQLINRQLPNEKPDQKSQIYSVGFHPWDIDQLTAEQFQKLESLAQQKNVLAIGECGIDRHISAPIDRQENLFIQQIELAEELRKSLIIHAVKSYPDIIRIKKSRTIEIPWILHGYNGNEQTTQQLNAYDFYFSIGPQLFRGSEKRLKSLQLIPLENLFFETDDSHVSIETIYNFAATKLGISMTELQALIFSNYKRIF
ncbi:MAG TPA: TatD family hydrolase [Sunxiuqinia sp.]|nr:TatD family hydrolase [Sunxiuqinia sp.]